MAAATLGGRVGFTGWLGNQPASLASAADLERHGVDTGFAPHRPDASPVRSTIIVGPDGDRFIAYEDDVPQGTSDTLDDAVLAQAPVLLIDAYATGSAPVVARARRLGLAVVADIEWSSGPATDRLMDLCDHLVLPLGFARSCTGRSDAADAVAALWSDTRSAVVVTDGERGTVVKQRGDPVLWHVPAYEVTAVDTTGAGDCFHGAYALRLAEGRSPLDCVVFATAASAISITGSGGRGALPRRDHCLALLGGTGAPAPVPMRGTP